MLAVMSSSRSRAVADVVVEPCSGIGFPKRWKDHSNRLVGCGIRIKYKFIKVYAVGTYMDPNIVTTKRADAQTLLSDPNYPRIIRIVMHRAVSSELVMAAFSDALEPRMQGHDLESLEQFQKLNPAVQFVKGSEMLLEIRGDTVIYTNAIGKVGTVRSIWLARALCDVYYGSSPVSDSHKTAVLEGLAKFG